MIGQLPEALEISGRMYAINADFRNILTIFEAFGDPALTDQEKAYICLVRLFAEDIPSELTAEAVKKAYWFCDGGDMPKTKPEQVRMIDWEHDEQMIFPAVSKAVGVIDVRSIPYMHWWTFLGSFGEIGEGLFSAVLGIRRKLASGKKLEKWEREFLRKNSELVRLTSAEDKAAAEETEEFLKTLI